MVLGLVETLRAQGYAVVRNLLKEEELLEVSAASEQLIRRWQAREINCNDFGSYKTDEAPNPILYCIRHLETKHPSFEQLARSEPLTGIVRRVFGVPATPTAFALIIKMPHYGGKVPYHSDPIDVPYGHVYNFSIYLDDSGPENGCFEVVPGSHLLPAREGMFDEKPEGTVFVKTRRGDVLIHDVRVVHGSAFSRSEKLRRSICVEFQPVERLEKIGNRSLEHISAEQHTPIVQSASH